MTFATGYTRIGEPVRFCAPDVPGLEQRAEHFECVLFTFEVDSGHETRRKLRADGWAVIPHP